MSVRKYVVLLCAALMIGATACSDGTTSPKALASAPRTPAREVIPGTEANIVESWSLSGDAAVGNIVNLNFTLTNVGTGDYVPQYIFLGETRPRGAFAEMVLPVGFKRLLPVSTPGVDNPYIVCEAYRGTHGGLTQANYSDICRAWWYGPIAAGASLTAVIPVKLQAEGDFTTWGGAMVYPTDPWNTGTPTYLNNNLWMPFAVHVNPAPPKVGTVGGLPDLQAGGKASTGSPAAGSSFYLLMTAKNSGKVDAETPSFTATVPTGLSVTSATIDFGSCTVVAQRVTCTSTHPVFVGMTMTAAIYLDAPTNAPGTYVTSGIWADGNGESSLTNNTSTVTVIVK